MKIVDVFKLNNSVLAYCQGDDISFVDSVKKINVGGKDITVLKYAANRSFTGQKSAIMELRAESPESVPLGNVMIMN